jgi:benzoate transport
MKLDLKRTIDDHPMSGFQVLVVATCIILNMLDGFDVLAVAFSAAHLSSDWHLGGKQIGLLLSSGLLGMAAGSLFIAPIADRIGRRPLILVCVLTIASGMLASSAAQNLTQLVLLRIVTGLGIGGMLASIAVIASEYSSEKWRSGAISMQSTGYAFGATVGGAVSGVLLTEYGWRSVFLFGGGVTAVVFPLVLYAVPESLAFLVARKPSRAVEKVNDILGRMAREEVDELPEQSAQVASEANGSDSASAFPVSQTSRTLLIWASFFLVMAGFYFVMSWTPKLLVQAGMSAVQGVTGGVLLNIGGMIGCTVFSLIATRVGVGRLLMLFLAASAALSVLFGLVSSSLQLSLAAAVLLGAAVSACVGGLYAMTPRLYSARNRATGVGWAIGMGRAGAIIAPVGVGALLDAGFSVPNLYYLFSLPFVAALLAVLYLPRQALVKSDDGIRDSQVAH